MTLYRIVNLLLGAQSEIFLEAKINEMDYLLPKYASDQRKR